MASDKKRAEDLGAYLVFLDESGYMLMGTVVRTWGPRGQTPVFRYHYRHDKVSVISGLSVSPRRHRVGLYFQVHLKNIERPDVCEFLKHLLRHLPGIVVLLWDRGGIHKGDPMRAFLEQHPRLKVEYFPGDAPELNPDEGVWNQTKKALANGRPDTVNELRQFILEELCKLSQSQSHLRACIHESELPLFLGD
jgi:transposase